MYTGPPRFANNSSDPSTSLSFQSYCRDLLCVYALKVNVVVEE